MDFNLDSYQQDEKWALPSSLVPESRKLTQVTGFAPISAVLVESQARASVQLDTSTCQAPTREFPMRLRKQYLSGKKNAVQCLHEACQFQHWPAPKFEEMGALSRCDGILLFRYFAIVNGHRYDIGQGKNKNEAKVDAATKALNVLFHVRDGEKLGKGPKVEADDFGTAVPSETGECFFSARSKSYKSIPPPVATLEEPDVWPAPQPSLVVKPEERDVWPAPQQSLVVKQGEHGAWPDPQSSPVVTPENPDAWPSLLSSPKTGSRKLSESTESSPQSSVPFETRNDILKPGPGRPAQRKTFSKKFRKEFINGTKNALQCFNEACQFQDWSHVFNWIEGTSNGTIFRCYAVVESYGFDVGEGTSKKKAKNEAARKALKKILGV